VLTPLRAKRKIMTTFNLTGNYLTLPEFGWMQALYRNGA